MAGSKEGAQAFMPSSNDSLFAPVNGGHIHHRISNSSSRSPQLHHADEISVTANNLPNESAILSPPSAFHPSDDSISPTDMSTLPSRRFVPSASSLPTSDSRPPTDQTFWHDHYHRAVELHTRERALWEEEKKFLEREIANLKQVLRTRRSDSSTSYFGSLENDKVYPDADIIRQAQEKLRNLSNASTSNDNGPSRSNSNEPSVSIDISGRRGSQDISPGKQSTPRGSASFFPTNTSTRPQLASISEDGLATDSGRRVSINDISTTIAQIPSADTRVEEDPPSPPTSAWAPTPPNARINAGRTPPMSVATNDGTIDNDETIANSIHNAIIDDDPELSSPKQLPSSPQNGQTDELSNLNKKLEQVAADPGANLPEVVRSTQTSPATSTSPSTTIPNQNNDRGEVKLKTRRSLNFGAPLGAPLHDPRGM